MSTGFADAVLHGELVIGDTGDQALVSDLLKNPRVAFQDRYYIPFTIAVNLIVFAIGSLLVGPFASFYFGFLLRMAVIHHSTFGGLKPSQLNILVELCLKLIRIEGKNMEKVRRDSYRVAEPA